MGTGLGSIPGTPRSTVGSRGIAREKAAGHFGDHSLGAEGCGAGVGTRGRETGAPDSGQIRLVRQAGRRVGDWGLRSGR